MEPLLITAEELDRKDVEGRLVRAWRVERLHKLGLPYLLADSLADRVDWHTLAKLIHRGVAGSRARHRALNNGSRARRSPSTATKARAAP